MTHRLRISAQAYVLLAALAGCSNSSPSGVITGRAILVGESDHAGILVTLSGPSSGSIVTDADGAFRFSKLVAGDYVVIASARSTRETTLLSATHVAGTVTLADLSFTPLGTLTGTVTLGGPTGNAGITVVAVGSSSVAVTDDAGRYTLSGLATGPHDLIASRDGYVSGMAPGVVVAYGETTNVPDLSLQRTQPTVPPGRIDGKVAIMGVADAHGVAVSLIGPVSAATSTAADGSYAFTGLVDGTYTITAAASSTAEQSETTMVAVGGGASSATLLTFTPLGSLVGKATLAGSSSGNGGILVFANGASLAAFTDDAGDYLLKGLPAGTYTIEATKTGFNVSSAGDQMVTYATMNAVPQIDLSPAPSDQATTIAGIATMIGKADSAGTNVSVGGTTSSTTTLSDGSYVLDGVPQGVYPLAFENGAYQELVPTVLAMAPGNGYVVDGTLYPLSTLEIPRGRRLLSSGDVSPIGLSGDGTHVIYWTDYTSSSGKLWVSPLAGGAATQVSTTGYGYSATLTPDASTAVYLSDVDSMIYPYPGSLHVRALATGADTTIAIDVDGFHVSPDGKYVALHRRSQNDVQLASLAGGAPTTIADEYCGFSPDSKSLLVATGGHLRIVSLVGASPIDMSWTGTCGTWTPDSQNLLIIDSNGLHRAAAATGSDAVLDPTANINTIIFSPDGSRFVYFTEPNGVSTPLARTALSSTGPVTTVSNSIYTLGKYAFSPDSNYFVFFPTIDTLQSWSAAGGTVTLATPPLFKYYDGFQISPDSANVMFDDQSDLYVAPIGGGAYTSLGPVVANNDFSEFGFSGDGTQAVFLRDNDVVIEPITSGPVTTIGYGIGRGRHALSPDGTKVWMLSSTLSANTLEVGYVAGGPPVALLNLVNPNTYGLYGLWWVGNDTIIAERINSPPPYRFQDGIYALAVP